MDAAWLFPLFFSEELAVLRAFVDDSVNCEDLLMNFMLANLTRTSAEPYAQVGSSLMAPGSTCAIYLAKAFWAPILCIHGCTCLSGQQPRCPY